MPAFGINELESRITETTSTLLNVIFISFAIVFTPQNYHKIEVKNDDFKFLCFNQIIR